MIKRQIDRLGVFLVLSFCAALIMTAMAIRAANLEQKEWEKFSASNNCKVVGRTSGSVQTGIGYGITSSGKFGTAMTTISTPSKTGYLCADGITYWR